MGQRDCVCLAVIYHRRRPGFFNAHLPKPLSSVISNFNLRSRERKEATSLLHPQAPTQPTPSLYLNLFYHAFTAPPPRPFLRPPLFSTTLPQTNKGVSRPYQEHGISSQQHIPRLRSWQCKTPPPLRRGESRPLGLYRLILIGRHPASDLQHLQRRLTGISYTTKRNTQL